jgi:Subtilisin inhibitor-like
MARIAVALAATTLAAAIAAAQSSGRTSLRITVWPNGKDGGSKTWTLRCRPPRGTLPHRARACHRLSSMKSPFKPVPATAVCAGVYGGPAVALVRGTFRGARVRTQFTRTDGCQIDRWNRVRFLFPVRVPPPV